MNVLGNELARAYAGSGVRVVCGLGVCCWNEVTLGLRPVILHLTHTHTHTHPSEYIHILSAHTRTHARAHTTTKTPRTHKHLFSQLRDAIVRELAGEVEGRYA